MSTATSQHANAISCREPCGWFRHRRYLPTLMRSTLTTLATRFGGTTFLKSRSFIPFHSFHSSHSHQQTRSRPSTILTDPSATVLSPLLSSPSLALALALEAQPTRAKSVTRRKSSGRQSAAQARAPGSGMHLPFFFIVRHGGFSGGRGRAFFLWALLFTYGVGACDDCRAFLGGSGFGRSGCRGE